MDTNSEEDSVYGLITELCERFIDKNKPEEHPYLSRKNTSGDLKRIRSRAFEILLNKSPSQLEEKQNRTDPIVELLKHTFVLRGAFSRYSQAEEIENLLDRLCDETENLDGSLYCALQFLSGLKTFKIQEENALEVFHYGRPNPLLPEQPKTSKDVPQYQIYPVEAFVVSERFEAMLGMGCSRINIPERNIDPYESLSLANHFKSATTIGIETLSTKSEHTIGSVLSAPRYTVRLVSTREFTASPYFVPGIMNDDGNKDDERESTYDEFAESPWLCVKSPVKDDDTDSNESDAETSNAVSYCRIEGFEEQRVEIWKDINDCTETTEHRTWETLGRCDAPQEPPFITETTEVMSHLERMKQAGFLLLLPSNVVGTLNVIKEVSTDIFMENLKLLLLGVESSTFIWNDKVGFRLMRNTIIAGLSVEAVKSACQDVTYWGGCYKSLRKLVKPDPQTGKMQQEGIIFRAMCNSVEELLLYYQAVILRISVDDEDARGLLTFLNNVRPVGSLMAEVARLCRCDRDDHETLGEGLGILSHIYDQVTGITKPNVALVFYSILKSCCEVYFRLLQKWLFEGICDDEYGEFMIKIRPQYAREKRHSFWTKAFAVNKNSVPGFLSNLAESILQCGKTVRLLKLCDPKNSLTSLFENSHPTVRVCLSVGMVRDQESICREYLERGEKLLGRNVSFSVAFEEQRNAAKDRAELVMNAQRDTLARIKRERQENKIEEARNKREFLAQLRDQAEEAATRKEREREAELLKDKRYLEDLNAADEIAKNLLVIEKQNTLDYYNELAAEAEKRRIRADWRARRMKLFQERSDFIERSKAVSELVEEEELESDKHAKVLDSIAKNLPSETTNIGKSNVPNAVEEVNESSPENANSKESEVLNPTITEIPENIIKSCDLTRETQVEIVAKKSPRPCVLNIKKTTGDKPLANLNENQEARSAIEKLNINTERPRDLRLVETDNRMSDSQRNKLRVLEQEYGMTPNNNELNIIVMDSEGNENTISIDASTIVNENTRKILQTEKERNRNRNTRHRTDSWSAETMATEKKRNISDAHERNNNEDRVTEEFVGVTSNVEMIVEMTEAQRNRKRNMAHTYRDPLEETKNSRVNFADTDLKRNRARVMGHDERNYRDYRSNEEIIGSGQCADLLTPMSQGADCASGVTPMSCTTDTFPTSNSESMTQLQNWEDCLQAEGKSISTVNVGDTPSSDSAFVDNPETPAFGNEFCSRSECYYKFFDLGSAETTTPIFESTLTVEDVEMIDNTSLHVYLEKSVVTPLRVQSRLANAAIVRYFIYDCNILSHLHSLRSFFFLLNGEFAKSLTTSLYRRLYEISAPMELFKTSTLTNFLEQALNSSLSSTYENSKRLSLSASDVPSQLQVSNPEFLNCLCLNYKISWPLNIVIDERILQQYSKVFKFLLMVGRVLYVLQEDFHILKVERKARMTSQYHKLQLYRHSMMQFITALHNYLTCSVLHESWTEFEKELAHATTIDEIYLTHVNYIKKILSRCMLTSRGEKMRTFLCNIFKVILKFHNRVRSQTWSTSAHVFSQANFERLENMYKTFCDARTYLAHVADKLARSGYQPHLTHFLNALNINSLYELTDPASSKKK